MMCIVVVSTIFCKSACLSMFLFALGSTHWHNSYGFVNGTVNGIIMNMNSADKGQIMRFLQRICNIKFCLVLLQMELRQILSYVEYFEKGFIIRSSYILIWNENINAEILKCLLFSFVKSFELYLISDAYGSDLMRHLVISGFWK